MNIDTDFGLRLHDRMTDDDPQLATVMYSTNGIEGPWFDMATGLQDHIEEILEALQWREDERRARRDEEAARFATEYDKLVHGKTTENKFGITPESQGSAKLTSNLVDRLRGVNPYSPAQVVELCMEAADEIERLRALCNDLYHDATCTESFCRLCGEGIQEWEARRG